MSSGLLLDTTVISEIPRPRPAPELVERIGGMPFPGQFLSAITVAELFRGALRVGAPECHLRNIRERLLPNVMVLPLDAGTAEVYGRLESDHRARGSRVDDFDLTIGATALQLDLTLVTRIVRHFTRMEALRILPTPGSLLPRG